MKEVMNDPMYIYQEKKIISSNNMSLAQADDILSGLALKDTILYFIQMRNQAYFCTMNTKLFYPLIQTHLFDL